VDQVTSASYASGRSVSYDYDAVGNRNSVTDSASTPVQPASYTTNSQNQYTAATGYTTVDYDGNGNLLTPANDWPVTYDSESRPVTNMGAEDVLYDARNRVIGRGILSYTYPTSSFYGKIQVYSGWNLVEEWNSDDTSVDTIYIYGPQVDELLCKLDYNTGVKLYYHQDGLGSTVALTNTIGNVAERYKYDVYGTPVITNASGTVLSHSAWANRILFTGREWFGDLLTPDNVYMAAYDYRNRVYSPTLGRFLQMDPLRFDANEVNLYRYTAGDPIDGLDPLGLMQLHGNWCGPAWVNGGRGDEGKDNIPQPDDPGYNKPKDALDSCCEGHDNCINQAVKKYGENTAQTRRAIADCDRGLSACAAKSICKCKPWPAIQAGVYSGLFITIVPVLHRCGAL
jgi:RHS repeat-associated protein